jgi:hypothetical protein
MQEQTLTLVLLAKPVHTLPPLVQQRAVTVHPVNILPIAAAAHATHAVLANSLPPLEKPRVPLAHQANSKTAAVKFLAKVFQHALRARTLLPSLLLRALSAAPVLTRVTGLLAIPHVRVALPGILLPTKAMQSALPVMEANINDMHAKIHVMHALVVKWVQMLSVPPRHHAQAAKRANTAR